MAASILNLFGDAAIEQFADYSIELEDIELDLTDYTGRAMLKKSFSSPTGVEFTVEFVSRTPPARIKLSLPHDQTALLRPGLYKWDFWIKPPDGVIKRLCRGDAAVLAGVTPDG